MSDTPPRRPLGPDLKNARYVDHWTIRGWDHDPVLVGVEDGLDVVIPIGGVSLSVGLAHLRDKAGDVRLGTPADDAPTPWELMAITQRKLRTALDAEEEREDEE